jgi:hypothetical protein
MLEAISFGQRTRRRSSWSSIPVACAALFSACAAVLGGCAVDDRFLLEADAAAGAAGADGGGGSGGSGGTRTAEDAMPPPRCIYPADETDAECVTLVENAGFHTDSNSWLREYDSIYLVWTEDDAAANAASGSITVINTLLGDDDGYVVAGARQCLPATPGKRYVVGADALIVGGQVQYGFDASPGPDAAKAGVSLLFYENPDCSGGSDPDNFTPTLIATEDAWTTIGGTKIAPDKVSAMAIRLVAAKPFRQISMKAHFDNVLVRAE